MRRLLPIAALVLPGCGSVLSMLEPVGPGAREVERLWWEFFWIVGTASVAVLLTLFLALARVRFGRKMKELPFILIGGAFLPLGMISAMLLTSLRTGVAVGSNPGDPAFAVEVIGHQFWWEVRYPDHGIVDANEIHLPAGTQVQLRLSSADVIHSFWVPKIDRKQDMLPGRWETIDYLVEEPGVYRGICTEFCGIQHALMAFEVVVHEPSGFEAWVRERRRPPAPLDTEAQRRGREVFVEANCSRCHAVQGLFEEGPTGPAGPDLTHVASRRTLGAATLPNNRGNLGGWILNPQPHKPGNRMPPVALPSEDFHALLDFLEGLR